MLGGLRVGIAKGLVGGVMFAVIGGLVAIPGPLRWLVVSSWSAPPSTGRSTCCPRVTFCETPEAVS